MTIDWPALFHAIKYYEHNIGSPMMNYHGEYCEWLLSNWGIEHGEMFIKVVDEKKYTAFLLRFA